MGASGIRDSAGSTQAFCSAYLDSKWTEVWACGPLDLVTTLGPGDLLVAGLHTRRFTH